MLLPTLGKPISPTSAISFSSSCRVNSSPGSPGSVSYTHLDVYKRQLYNITDMIEKPAPGKEFSLFSILGRCLLTPEIYEILDGTAPGAGGEIQLTDAMAVLARTGGMVGVDFTVKRYDMGSKLGVMQAQVETALRHPDIGAEFHALSLIHI